MLPPIIATPRSYQLEAVRWFKTHTKGRVIIGDEMGLGKTGEMYMIWRDLGFPQPCLLVAGRNAQIAWLNQAAQWGCPQPVIVQGNAAIRAALWKKHSGGFVTTTRESLKRDIASGVVNARTFKTLLVDECHKDANRKTGNYRTLKIIGSTATYIIMASGSVVRRGPQSLWGPLNIIAPRRFSSYWKFINQYCDVEEGFFGVNVVGTKDEEKLQTDLADLMIARLKKDVRKDMPAKFRDLDSNILEMTSQQAKMYNNILEEGMHELTSGEAAITPTILAKIMRMRQILVTPKLIDPEAEYGAGIDRLIELLDEAGDQHMCVFSPFSSALPYVQQALVAAGYEADRIIQLSGGLSLEELMSRIRLFKERKGIALVSIKFAESFDLQPATWGVFLGYEWDPWDNLQAEDRLHRGEITDPVTLYYLRYREGIDSSLMLDSLNVKTQNVMGVLKNFDSVRRVLQTKVRPNT